MNNISLLVAIATNGIIGKGQNDIPWYLPKDLKFFKEKTTGHTVVMGKNTFLSIINRIGKPLPNRTTIVVSSDTSLELHGVTVVPSLQKAIEIADPTKNICISGGVRMYEEGVKIADTLYITRVHTEAKGDIFFPGIDWRPFNKKESITYPVDDKHECSYTFELYERKN